MSGLGATFLHTRIFASLDSAEYRVACVEQPHQRWAAVNAAVPFSLAAFSEQMLSVPERLMPFAHPGSKGFYRSFQEQWASATGFACDEVWLYYSYVVTL